MLRFARSLIDFVGGMAVAAALFAAAIGDPLHWLRAVGVVTSPFEWIISPAWRQALFAALGLAWLFWWYHKQRVAFDDRQPSIPDTPLHKAARYISRDSVWAVAQKPEDDADWPLLVDYRYYQLFSPGVF